MPGSRQGGPGTEGERAERREQSGGAACCPLSAGRQGPHRSPDLATGAERQAFGGGGWRRPRWFLLAAVAVKEGAGGLPPHPGQVDTCAFHCTLLCLAHRC